MGWFLVLQKLLLVRVWFLVRVLSRVLFVLRHLVTAHVHYTKVWQIIGWCFQSWWKQCTDLVYLRVSDHLTFYYLGTAHIFQLQSSLTVAKTCFLGWRASLSVKYDTQLINEQRIFSVSILYFQKVLDSAFMIWTILQIDWSVICLNLNAVEPPCATTSCKRPPPITQIFAVNAL